MDAESIQNLLDQQEAIAKKKLEQDKEQQEHTRLKNDGATDNSPSPRNNDRDRERDRDRDRDRDRGRRDDHHRRRREHDHYDGRRNGTRQSSDRYMSEREENDHRRSRRSKNLTDDADARPGSDGDSMNGSTRSKNRSRSPRRNDSRRYRSRSPSPYRTSRGDRSYRPSNGSHHDRYDDRTRDDDRRGGGRRRTPPSDARPRNSELTEEERDRRTVFCQQLANRTKNGHLKKFFEQVGAVREATIVVDRVSGRSKGVGYVEFVAEDSVPEALKLTGRQLNGIPIIVANTEADKNRSARTKETTSNRNNTQPQTRLYVGNIQFNLSEEDLIQVFQPWGELKHVVLQKDDGGRSRGYAFVEYVSADSAKQALENMNNFMLGDRAIRVGLGGDRNSNFPEADKADADSRMQGSSFSGMGGRGTHAGGSGGGGGRETDRTGGASALDDVDMEGVNFNNFNRDALMRKLARKDDLVQPSVQKAEPKKTVVTEPNPTRCILLKNVYDQHSQDDPNWKTSIKEDIVEECEQKYGKVVHIELDLANGDGDVYVKFADVNGGQKAYRGLQGRWFDKHQITAQYVVDIVYNSLYPKAANL